MVLRHRHPIYGPTLPNEVFTLGKAIGGAKGASDPSAVPTDPFGRIRHEFRVLGSSLDRFDASLKSALRKIPGSRMPPPRAEARAAEAARAAKPGLFDRLRSGGKGKARKAPSEPEKDSRGARKEKTQKKRATTKKATEKTEKKTVPASAPEPSPAAVPPEPAKAPRQTKRPTEAVSEPTMRASAKTRADDSEVRDYISRSYAPRDAGEKNELLPAKKESASMPPKPPQKVTFADLDDKDKSVVARARAAMAHVEPTPANLAAGAAALLAAHVLAKAWRARGGNRQNSGAAEEKLDIDSAFGTPTREGVARNRPDAKDAKGKASASMPATGTASAKRLVFGDETAKEKTAAALKTADVNIRQIPSRASSSKQNRFGVGADALAAAVRAKITVIKATKRLKKSGELRVDVLEATFLETPETFAGDDQFTFRVAVDAERNDSIRGSTSARAFDNKHMRDVVTFNSRLAFSLPASSDGHAGKRVEARLCDKEGRTVAKTAVLLRAALRAAPVTKSFPLHDRAGAVVGTARLAIEWDYAKEEVEAKENEAVSAAAKFLAAVKE